MLPIGQLKTYIINCPELHPLSWKSLGQYLESKGQEDAAKVQYSLHLTAKSIRQSNGNCTFFSDADI